MPVKRSVQSESIVAPAVTVDPLHMVALISGDDEVFLVDRNCILVSQRCRRYVDEVERLVASAAANTPGDDLTFDATFGSSSHGGNSSVCASPKVRVSAHGGRGSDQVVSPDDAGDDAWRDVRIPYCDLDAMASLPPQSQVPLQHVSISELFDACRKVALTRQSSAAQQTDSQRPLTGRKSMTTQKPHMRPFIVLTGTDGGHRYPVIPLPDVPSHLLTLGVQFMYDKYQADNDVEKRPQSMSTTFSECDTAALIAVSALLEM